MLGRDHAEGKVLVPVVLVYRRKRRPGWGLWSRFLMVRWYYCLGAPLARLEGRIAFDTLLRRIPEFRVAVPAQTLPRKRGIFLRGLVRLPLLTSN